MYTSPANPLLGIALANVYANKSLSVQVSLRDQDGFQVGQRFISIPPLGHIAMNLGNVFPGLRSGFVGSVLMSTEVAHHFVAWTLNSDAETGLLSTLPSGRFAWPVSHWERVWLVFLKMADAAKRLFPALEPLELRISEENEINAYALPDKKTIQINLATSELMGDSDSELAFVVAHEIGHIVQAQIGRLSPSLKAELEADAIGVMLLLFGGYDPYAAAGVFGKLQMASGVPGILGEILRDILDPHTSYSTRSETALLAIALACSYDAQMKQLCDSYKLAIHTHFPPGLPLWQPPPPAAQSATHFHPPK